MSKEFYDAKELLAICEAVKLKKCSTCGSFLMELKSHCETCDIKFIVDLLQAFPKVKIDTEGV